MRKLTIKIESHSFLIVLLIFLVNLSYYKGMNKIQKVNFKSVDEFLDYIPERELLIVEELRSLVFECIPEVTEKLSFNVPFFKRNRNICCIWPASIPWGNVPENGVHLGFTSGNLINDFAGLLSFGTRKQVGVLTYFSLDDIDADLVRAYLFDAIDVDNQFRK